MHCTYSIEETKELTLSLYSDSIGVNKGKRPSLCSDKHVGVKVKHAILIIVSQSTFNVLFIMHPVFLFQQLHFFVACVTQNRSYSHLNFTMHN